MPFDNFMSSLDNKSAKRYNKNINRSNNNFTSYMVIKDTIRSLSEI